MKLYFGGKKKKVSEPSRGFHTDLGRGGASSPGRQPRRTQRASLSSLPGPSQTPAGPRQGGMHNCACVLEVSPLGGPGS